MAAVKTLYTDTLSFRCLLRDSTFQAIKQCFRYCCFLFLVENVRETVQLGLSYS